MLCFPYHALTPVLLSCADVISTVYIYIYISLTPVLLSCADVIQLYIMGVCEGSVKQGSTVV